MKRILIVAIVLGALSFVLIKCQQYKELRILAVCDFRFAGIERTELAGVDISAIKSFSDLNFVKAAKVTTAFARGEMPLKIRVLVEAKNEADKMAAINHIDWIAYIDDIQIAKGYIDRRIEIQPESKEIIPINISTELFKLLSGESRNAVLNFGFNLMDVGAKESRITLRLKPSFKVGKKYYRAPGYIKISKKFYASGN